MIDSPLCPQILTFWSIPRFSLKLQHFDPPTLYVLKLQHFDWFQNLNLISVLWWIPPLHPNFNILMDLTFCTKIVRFPMFHSNFNILINSPVTLWSIPKLSLNFDILIPPFHSNLNIMIKFWPLWTCKRWNLAKSRNCEPCWKFGSKMRFMTTWTWEG